MVDEQAQESPAEECPSDTRERAQAHFHVAASTYHKYLDPRLGEGTETTRPCGDERTIHSHTAAARNRLAED